ncbi:hypothetical protein [Lysobacter sp. CA199]|uniref:hypothetical protein n=1 Tax=Lysobacter sp. CA199 TaxID=3455608 RepID=UPI003F8CF8FD
MHTMFRLPVFAGLFALTLPLSALASPPPTATLHQQVCGDHWVDLDLVFGQTATTATVRSEADFSPSGFSPPAPLPQYYVASVTVSSRNTARPNWSTSTQDKDGYDSYISDPLHVGNSVFKGAGCELAATATVNVQCNDGHWEYKSLSRNWLGCGM